MQRKIRSVFVSDTHLGSKFAQTDFLLDFMKWVDKQRPEKFYIVGDFIDGWKLQKNWHWDKSCNLILRKIFSMLKHDTEVFYVAGNHDEFLRCFLEEMNGVNFAGLKIADEFIHIRPNGKRFLVIHGDQFDTAIRYAMKYTHFLCNLGDWTYDWLIRSNQMVNWFRKKLGFPYWSFSKAIKHQFKNAMKYIGGFEEILVNYANERECQGVVCGHIHKCCIHEMENILYVNCGDWVESHTAIIEYDDGELVIFDYSERIVGGSIHEDDELEDLELQETVLQ